MTEAPDAALDAFLGLVAEKGYANVALRDVAAGAGLALAELYRRYPDKAALVGQRLSIQSRPARGAAKIEILMGDVEEEVNPYSGRVMHKRVDVRRPEPMWDEGGFESTESERVPRAYYVPAAEKLAIERLRAHGIVLERAHEGVGHRDADIEVGQIAFVLGVNEVLDVRVVAAQDSHLRAAARAGRFHRLAALVEYPHVRHRAARRAPGAAHFRASRPDGREVVPDAAASAHGLGRFHQRHVDAGLAADRFRYRIPDRLHEAVDERRLQLGAGSGVHAPARNESLGERVVEDGLPAGRVAFDRGERLRHAPAHVFDAALVALRVLFQ